MTFMAPAFGMPSLVGANYSLTPLLPETKNPTFFFPPPPLHELHPPPPPPLPKQTNEQTSKRYLANLVCPDQRKGEQLRYSY